MKSPELNQMSPPYTVGVTYHVSLEFSVSNSLLHCARGDSKYLCAVAHLQPCREANRRLFCTHGAIFECSTYFLILSQYLPFTQFLACGQVKHLSAAILLCYLANVFCRFAVNSTFEANTYPLARVACLLSYFLYCASWRKHFFLCHNLINLNNVPLRVPMLTHAEVFWHIHYRDELEDMRLRLKGLLPRSLNCEVWGALSPN